MKGSYDLPEDHYLGQVISAGLLRTHITEGFSGSVFDKRSKSSNEPVDPSQFPS